MVCDFEFSTGAFAIFVQDVLDVPERRFYSSFATKAVGNTSSGHAARHLDMLGIAAQTWLPLVRDWRRLETYSGSATEGDDALLELTVAAKANFFAHDDHSFRYCRQLLCELVL